MRLCLPPFTLAGHITDWKWERQGQNTCNQIKGITFSKTHTFVVYKTCAVEEVCRELLHTQATNHSKFWKVNSFRSHWVQWSKDSSPPGPTIARKMQRCYYAVYMAQDSVRHLEGVTWAFISNYQPISLITCTYLCNYSGNSGIRYNMWAEIMKIISIMSEYFYKLRWLYHNVNTPQSESIIPMQIRSKGVNGIQSSAMPISDTNLSYRSPIKWFGKFTSHCPFLLNYQCYFGCDALGFLHLNITLCIYECIIMHNHNVIVYALHKYIDYIVFSVGFVSWVKWINITVSLSWFRQG